MFAKIAPALHDDWIIYFPTERVTSIPSERRGDTNVVNEDIEERSSHFYLRRDTDSSLFPRRTRQNCSYKFDDRIRNRRSAHQPRIPSLFLTNWSPLGRSVGRCRRRVWLFCHLSLVFVETRRRSRRRDKSYECRGRSRRRRRRRRWPIY